MRIGGDEPVGPVAGYDGVFAVAPERSSTVSTPEVIGPAFETTSTFAVRVTYFGGPFGEANEFVEETVEVADRFARANLADTCRAFARIPARAASSAYHAALKEVGQVMRRLSLEAKAS